MARGDERALVIWIFAALLVVWGNVTSAALGSSAWLPGGSWSFIASGLALVVVSVVAGRAMSLDRRALGLVGSHALGALSGVLLGAIVAAVGVLLLLVAGPAIVGRPIEYAPLAAVTAGTLTPHIAFFLPLGDILPEELAFRGVLLGAFVRSMSATRAIAGAAIVFALWHLAVVRATIDDTSLGRPSVWFVPALVGALIVVAIGGAVFAWLRLRTGSLATTIAAHWSFDAVLLVGLSLGRASVPPSCC